MSLMPPDIEHQTEFGHFEIVEFCLTDVCPDHLSAGSEGQVFLKTEKDRYRFRHNRKKQPQLPLADLVFRARLRGLSNARVQVLLVLDASDCLRSDLIAMGQELALAPGIRCDLCVACVSGAERIDHVDYLHALVSGFSFIVILRGEKNASQLDQHVKVAAALGAHGRAGVIRCIEEARTLLSHCMIPEAFEFEEIDKNKTERDLVRLCAAHLMDQATSHVVLPEGAPYGSVAQASGCSGCQLCVCVCPNAAISFAGNDCKLTVEEDACTQCGMCVSACSAGVLQLLPRLDLRFTDCD